MSSEKHSKPRAGDRRSKEIAACLERADLQPPILSDGGFSLDHHYRATAVAGVSSSLDLDLPLERPNVNLAKEPLGLKR